MIRFMLRMLLAFTLRCPNCREESMLRNPYVFHERCGHCGLVYQKDEGDFWGGMVISYTFAGFFGLTTAWLLWSLQMLSWEARAYTSTGVAVASILLLFPFAKALWVYLLFFTRGQYAEYRPPEPGTPGGAAVTGAEAVDAPRS